MRISAIASLTILPALICLFLWAGPHVAHADVTSIADLEASSSSTPTPTPTTSPLASGKLPNTGLDDGTYLLAIASITLVTVSLVRIRQRKY